MLFHTSTLLSVGPAVHGYYGDASGKQWFQPTYEYKICCSCLVPAYTTQSVIVHFHFSRIHYSKLKIIPLPFQKKVFPEK